jgi:GUCT (NUC152) domain
VQKQFPGLTFADTIAWRLTADSMGVVVDVVQDKVQVKMNEAAGTTYIILAGVVWKDARGITLEVCTELPPLKERAGFGDQSMRGRGRGGSCGGAGRGGFGGRGRGRGGY